MNIENLFDIFGLDVNSTKDDITKRYKMLIKKLHPDKDKDIKSHEYFMKTKLIYEILMSYVDNKENKFDDSSKSDYNIVGNVLACISEYINDNFNTNIDLNTFYNSFMTTYNNIR